MTTAAQWRALAEQCRTAIVPDAALMAAMNAQTEDCHEGIQYVLLRGLNVMGFAMPLEAANDLIRECVAAFCLAMAEKAENEASDG